MTITDEQLLVTCPPRCEKAGLDDIRGHQLDISEESGRVIVAHDVSLGKHVLGTVDLFVDGAPAGYFSVEVVDVDGLREGSDAVSNLRELAQSILTAADWMEAQREARA